MADGNWSDPEWIGGFRERHLRQYTMEMTDAMRRCLHRQPALRQPAKPAIPAPTSPASASEAPKQPLPAPASGDATGGAHRGATLSHDQNNPDCSPCRPQPERAVRHESLGQEAREESHSGRVSVRVTSYRRRLLDPDNLCPKYFVDACRYAGFIRDDTAEEIEFTVGQVKVKAKEEERTEITIEMP